MEWNRIDCSDIKTYPPTATRVIATDIKEKHPSVDFCWFYGDAVDKEDWVSEQGNVSVPTHWAKLELPNE